MRASATADPTGAAAGAVVDASVAGRWVAGRWVAGETGSEDAAVPLDGRPILLPELGLPDGATIL